MKRRDRVLEEVVRVSTKRKSRVESMRVKREGKVESKWWATEKEAARMEAKRLEAVMKHLLEFSFRLCLIYFSLEVSFRFCWIDFYLKFSFRSTFRILYWLQIEFKFILDC